MGTHVWRQCNSLALARNYHEEDMRIWLPRIDKRYNFPGTTGPSFTAYEYTLAVAYKIFGFSHTLHRKWSLIISLWVIAGLFFVVRSYNANKALAFFISLSLTGIPEFYYHSINALPDILALGCMLWGWLAARNWLTKGNGVRWIWATVLLGLAGMIKLQFLIAGVILAAEVYNKYRLKQKIQILGVVLMATVVVSMAIAWYNYARYLTFQYWLNEFVHQIRLPESITEFMKIGFKNLISDLPETWVGYGLLPGFVFGSYLILRNREWRLAVVCTISGVFVIYFLLQKQFLHHGYYSLFFTPFVAIAAGFGYYKMVQFRQYAMAVVLLLLAPLWSWARMEQNWTVKKGRVPQTLLDTKLQNAILELSDTSKRYIVGPDSTGCVYFYYLHAKGFPLYYLNEKQSEMVKWMRWGADGFITDQPAGVLARFSDSIEFKETGRVGEFIWFDVRLKQP